MPIGDADWLENAKRRCELERKLAEEKAEATARKALESLGKNAIENIAKNHDPNLPPLTPQIAYDKGVGGYSIPEIIMVLKCSRATAYRLKKSGEPLTRSDVVRERGAKLKTSDVGPSTYDPYMEAVRRALYAVRGAKKELAKRKYRITEACYEVARKLEKEASMLAFEIEERGGFGDKDDDDDFDFKPPKTTPPAPDAHA